MNGGSVSKSVVFSLVKYTVKFTESGLPSGTSWSVTFNGSTLSSTTDTISITAANGTYSYSVGSVLGYTVSPSSGSITVNGKNVSKSITFTPKPVSKYTVTFTESGLPTSTTWYVNITGMISSGPITGSTYSVSLSNGTYSYTIGTTDKTYHANGGSFTESAGTPSSVSVTFAPFTYSVTFTETGLPAGTNWNMTFNGTIYNLTNTSYTFHVVNGTYSYSIGNVSGYNVSKQSSTTTVNGNNMTVPITFTANSSSSPPPPSKLSSPSGISSTELYAIIGAVVAVAAIGSALVMITKRK